MSFRVAIVGRPNVGKSTLFNRLVGKRVALVDDHPGVTRDRREGEARLGDLRFTVVDTAGLQDAPPASLLGRMLAHTKAAIAASDAILFVIDARVGPTPDDRAFADLVRRSHRPTLLIANKSEGSAGQLGALESYGLGLGEPVLVSAEHGEGLSDLYDALRAALPDRTASIDAAATPIAPVAPGDERAVRVAIVGRPNSGKSTLINRLLGQERLLTGPEPGLTRDSIAVDLAWRGRAFRLYDTAGLRRRARIDEKLEKLSVADALRAIRFAEVVIVLMDAEHAFEEQDLRIADLVESEGRAVVLSLNKWDRLKPRPGAITTLRRDADHFLPQLHGVPVAAISGLLGEGLDRLMEAVVEAYAVWNRRLPTAALNRWLASTLAEHPPPAVSGRRIKLNYLTQPKARPPSFVLFCSRADALPEAYRRYLVNSLRAHFDLPGTPIRLTLREKPNPFRERRRPGTPRSAGRSRR
jgi:GTPase